MKILFCGTTFAESVQLLSKLLPEHKVMNCQHEDLPKESRDATVLIPLMTRVERSTMDSGTVGLVQQWGVGLEGVDIKAASEMGILVCNVPGDVTPNADSTAEHAVFLMMGVSRKINQCFDSLQKGVCGSPMGEALFGKTALIVGFGKVGRALARRLIPLGMVVDISRRSPDKEMENEIGIRRAGKPSDILEMAAQSDFVVSTVILTDETRNLFSRKLFDRMKNSAFVINVSRGPVINEEDLISALKDGSIAGAGLDVFAAEPVDPHHPLLGMSNVLATPHIAGVTRQNYRAIGDQVRENILKLSRNEIPNYCVNLDSVSKNTRFFGKFPYNQS